MTEVPPADRARKSHKLFLNTIDAVVAGDVAKAMGVSDARVSEIKNKYMEDACRLLSHLGLKIVPAKFRCLDEDTFQFLTSSHAMIVKKAPELLWEEPTE